MKTTILFAEDDPNLGYMTKEGLEAAGFEVHWFTNGDEAWRAFKNQDLCLIDIMMPKMDGFSLAQRIREKDDNVPILFLTAKSREEDRLRGFEIGGDDYISKPFSMPELVYRLQVFKRRKKDGTPAENAALGDCTYDHDNLVLTVNKHTRTLTQREGDLLQLLLTNKNQLVKREDILVTIWGSNDYFMGRSLDVFISRLRKYLKADPRVEIRNHHGVGFILICQ